MSSVGERPNTSKPRAISDPYVAPLYQYVDRVRRVGEVDQRRAALVRGLHEHVAARDRHQRRDVAHAVLLRGLDRRDLVVAAELELPVDDVVDRVPAPAELVGRAAARGGAAAPFVGEHDGLAVVAERRAVPVRVQRIGDGVEPLRVGRGR
jgi:hypothetical protein